MRTSLLLCLLLAALSVADAPTARMLSIARQEWEYFGRQTILGARIVQEGHKESEDVYSDRVALYWKEGVNLTWTGKDTHEPWSAAFISYVMRKAGLGDRFEYSDWHAHYIRHAIRARREQDPRYAFWAYRLSERAPQVGDIVCYAREEGIDFDRQREVYKSHGDLVVAVRPAEIDVIGGNVQDSVSLKTLATDAEGKLIDQNQRWFAVLANRLTR
ncbi:DUF2272 domain-containing protein [bacterium CPR1]|nr:DUF2272 domain-containing protein [bacterium CPR1]